MSGRREPKKSETLEVRLSHDAKSALMRKAQAEGRSASDVVRESIASYLAEQPKEARSMFITVWKPAAAAGAAAVALVWSALAPAPATAGPDFRALFAQFDSNKDGAITTAEFRKGHLSNRFVVKAQDAAPPAAPMMIPLHGAAPKHVAHGRAGMPPEMLAGEFAQQDADRDGSVSFAEFEAFHVRMHGAAFANVDRNGDRSVGAAELAAIAAALPKGAPSPQLATLDTDGDGKLSQSEFFAHHP